MSIQLTRDSEYPHVLHLRFDFGKLNLLTPDALETFTSAIDDIPNDVSVVTIRGTGDEQSDIGGLTGGLNLEEVRNVDAQEARSTLDLLYEMMERVRDLRAVTVCSCGEYALGAGLELAMSCDFRVATEDAVLGLPEIDIGLVTGIQGGLLIHLVGLQTAKELIFTGKPVSGVQGADIGLVNAAEPPETYEETLTDLVTTLAEKPPQIVRWQTDVFRAWRSNGIESGIASSRETIALCFGTNAQRDAMANFLNI